MAHCTKCGAEVPVNAQFCQTCGQTQATSPAAASAAQPVAAAPVAESGMSENTAATLSYVLGWLTGIIFFLIDKRPYVRFHAAQSIVTFGGLHIIEIVLGMIFGVGWMFGGMGHYAFGGFWLGLALLRIVGLLTFILWIVCMIKAASGQKFTLPIAGPIAHNLAGS
jgi:uncharacterized membrane protein